LCNRKAGINALGAHPFRAATAEAPVRGRQRGPVLIRYEALVAPGTMSPTVNDNHCGK
jgi:hypothetical protein